MAEDEDSPLAKVKDALEKGRLSASAVARIQTSVERSLQRHVVAHRAPMPTATTNNTPAPVGPSSTVRAPASAEPVAGSAPVPRHESAAPQPPVAAAAPATPTRRSVLPDSIDGFGSPSPYSGDRFSTSIHQPLLSPRQKKVTQPTKTSASKRRRFEETADDEGDKPKTKRSKHNGCGPAGLDKVTKRGPGKDGDGLGGKGVSGTKRSARQGKTASSAASRA